VSDVSREICLSPSRQLSWAALVANSDLDIARQIYLARAEFCSPKNTFALWRQIMRLACDRVGVDPAVALARGCIASQPPTSRLSAYLAVAAWLFDEGHVLSAISFYRRAYCFAPERPEPIHNLALVSRHSESSGLREFRRDLFVRAMVASPLSERIAADLLYERHVAGERIPLRDVLRIANATLDVVALATLSSLAMELGSTDFASEIASRALVIRPGSYIGYSKRAMAVLMSSEWAAAEIDLSRSQRLHPPALEPRINFARLLELHGNMRGALEVYEESLRRRPDLAEPRLNSAIILLGLGQFALGWQRYDARWLARSVVTHDRAVISQPLNTRKPKFDRSRRDRVLVWAEQGLGDEIMFASMFVEVEHDAAQVIVQVDPRLMSLFRRSFPRLEFHKRVRPVDESLYDSQIAMGDLGSLYRTATESFPRSRSPYLHADLKLSDAFRERFGSQKKRIGISWHTANPDTGRHRSLELDRLCQIFAGLDVTLINLQYKSDPECVKSAAEKYSLDVCSFSKVDNFYEVDRLASLICCCDLVITIGNATAHLSAALGVRTWVITPVGGSWRWMFEGSTTPWYPTVEVFRQTNPGQWDRVFTNLRARLDELLSA
jgi:tetratricopeptide (TPR) repeat protein